MARAPWGRSQVQGRQEPRGTCTQRSGSMDAGHGALRHGKWRRRPMHGLVRLSAKKTGGPDNDRWARLRWQLMRKSPTLPAVTTRHLTAIVAA